MEEKLKNEIEKSAQYIEMTGEEALAKFQSICEENTTAPDSDIALALWRTYVANVRRMNKSSSTSTTSSGGSNSSKESIWFLYCVRAT